MISLVKTIFDVTDAPMMVFIGGRSGTMEEKDVVLERLRNNPNKRGDPLHAAGPFHLLCDEDKKWLLSYCSGPLYLSLIYVGRLLTVRTEWSKK